jgi:hypothetical protein
MCDLFNTSLENLGMVWINDAVHLENLKQNLTKNVFGGGSRLWIYFFFLLSASFELISFL